MQDCLPESFHIVLVQVRLNTFGDMKITTIVGLGDNFHMKWDNDRIE